MHNDENTWLARLADRHEVGSAHLMIDIDLDGVCSDYVEGLRQFVAKERGLNPQDLPDPDSYNIAKASGWPFESTEDYLETHRRAVKNHLYRDLPVYDGVTRSFKKLSDKGFHIRVVTHRLLLGGLHQQVVTDTAAWLEANRLPYMSLCFVRPKDTMRATLHIEDAPSNIEHLLKEDELVIIFDQPYNGDVEGPRVTSWDQITKLILKAFNK